MREPAGGRRLIRLGAGLCALLALAAAAAPWLSRHSPERPVATLGASYLPPATRAWEVRLTDGRRWLARRVERTPDGLRVERDGRVIELAAERVANLTPDGVGDRRFFLLGTDRLGRDCWARLLFGARVSLAVALAAAVLAGLLGLAVGLAAGTLGGWVDAALMRLVDGLRAFPRLFLLVLLAALFDPGPWFLIAVLGATGWMGVSRLVRAEVLRVKGRDFVVAARAAGSGPLSIAARHLAPHVVTPLLAATTLRVGNVILVEAALSYLGLGIPAPHPTWGNMIYDAAPDLVAGWWAAAFPGLAIALTVIAVTLVGDGLRDRLGRSFDADGRL